MRGKVLGLVIGNFWKATAHSTCHDILFLSFDKDPVNCFSYVLLWLLKYQTVFGSCSLLPRFLTRCSLNCSNSKLLREALPPLVFMVPISRLRPAAPIPLQRPAWETSKIPIRAMPTLAVFSTAGTRTRMLWIARITIPAPAIKQADVTNGWGTSTVKILSTRLAGKVLLSISTDLHESIIQISIFFNCNIYIYRNRNNAPTEPATVWRAAGTACSDRRY